MSKKKILIFLYFAVILIFSVIRFAFLDADPILISWSKSAYTDIGYYVYNARNAILFNNPFFGTWDNTKIFFVYHYIYLIWFKLAGINFFNINLLSSIIGVLSIIISFLILKKYNAKNIYLNTLFLLINFVLIAVNRAGFMENFMILFLLMSIYFSGYIFLSLVFFIFAVFCKTFAVVFLIPVVYLAYKNYENKKAIVFFIFMFGLILGIFYYFNMNSNISNFTLKNKLGYILRGINLNYFLVLLSDNIYIRNFIQYFLMIITISYVWINKENNVLDNLFLLIFIFYCLFLIFAGYCPARYRVIGIYPLCYFASRFFYLNFKEGFSNKKKYISLILFCIFFILIGYSYYWGINRSILNEHFYYLEGVRQSIIISIIILIFILVMLKRIKQLYVNNKEVINYLLIFAIIIFQSSQYAKYLKYQRDYDLKNISIELGEIIKGGILTGWFAPNLSLNNNIRVLADYNQDSNLWKKYNVKYLILQGNNNNEVYSKHLLENIKYKLVKKFYIKNINTNLYLFKISGYKKIAGH